MELLAISGARLSTINLHWTASFVGCMLDHTVLDTRWPKVGTAAHSLLYTCTTRPRRPPSVCHHLAYTCVMTLPCLPLAMMGTVRLRDVPTPSSLLDSSVAARRQTLVAEALCISVHLVRTTMGRKQNKTMRKRKIQAARTKHFARKPERKTEPVPSLYQESRDIRRPIDSELKTELTLSQIAHRPRCCCARGRAARLLARGRARGPASPLAPS